MTFLTLARLGQLSRLKLHISPCPNDTFMFDAIINNRIECRGLSFDVEYHDIEELNCNALNAVADISKISCAILPQIAPHYSLLDSGAALGRGNGPLLVRRKGESSPIRNIAVPGLNTTANLLISKLFPSIESRTPILFSQIATQVEQGQFDAGVLIHEGRFLYHQHNLELVADLGLLWEERYSLPLPLGAITIRSSLSEQIRSQFESLLRQSVEYAFANPTASRQFIKEHAQEMDDKVIESHIELFVNDFSISLGDQGRMAINTLCSKEA